MSWLQIVQVTLPTVLAVAIGLFVAPKIDALVGEPPKRERIAKVLTVLGVQVIAITVSGVLAFTSMTTQYDELRNSVREENVAQQRYIESRTEALQHSLRAHAAADDQSLPFFRAALAVADIPDPAVAAIFRNGLQWQKDLAARYAEGRMHVARHQIFTTWEACLNAADARIRATNAVSANDWKGFSRDGAGLAAQKRAMERGRAIERLMLYSASSQEHLDGLRLLGTEHRKLGINVRYQDRRWVRNAEKYRDLLQRLGTDDFVLIDDRMLLLTYLDGESHQMLYSELSRDPELIRVADKLWHDLWSEASAAPPLSLSSVERSE